MIPPCATCNDRGMIPTEYGSQPCPMCVGWERMRKIDQARDAEREQPPSEWVELVIYIAIAAAAFLAVLVVFGAPA